MLVAFALGCTPAQAPVREPVSATLTGAGMSGLAVADALEALIANGAASPAERRYAYQRVSAARVVTAGDALGRAIVAGRLAQVSGLGAPSLVAEVERYARLSAELDANLRSGAAQRLLGTLYVMAPAALLEHGDSEVGLELLADVARRFPAHVQNRLRLAEGYVALGDPEPARPHLCHCAAHRSELRADERKLLDELLEQARVSRCP
jgi:hypothetical protein